MRDSSRTLALVLAIPLAGIKPRERIVLVTRGPGVPVASVEVIEGKVELSGDGRQWSKIQSGHRLKTGERIRTAEGALARVEFPWMNVVVGASSVFAVGPEQVLSTILEQGRAEEHAETGVDAVKLRTPEALVRGRGRVVVRRGPEDTAVSVLEGTFRVEAAGGLVALAHAQGTLVRAGQKPSAARDLPDAPQGQSPGADPLYVLQGQPVRLSWDAAAPAHHVQVLGVGLDDVVLDRDVAVAPVEILIPWLGTFRWSVAALEERGLEGLPSAQGLFVVVDK